MSDGNRGGSVSFTSYAADEFTPKGVTLTYAEVAKLVDALDLGSFQFNARSFDFTGVPRMLGLLRNTLPKELAFRI